MLEQDCSNQKIEAALELIGQCPIGRVVADQIRPLLSSGDVKIQQLSEPASPNYNDLKQIVPKKGHVGGGFTFDGKDKVIWLDLNGPSELLAALLLHEAVHAVDESFLRSFEEATRLIEKFKGEAQLALKNDEVAGRVGDSLLGLWNEAERFYQRRLFRAERRAYDVQLEWIQQAATRLKHYPHLMRQAYAHGYVFERKMSDQEIISAYGLHSIAA